MHIGFKEGKKTREGLVWREIIDFFTGSGTGLVASCLFSPDSTIRTIVIIVGLLMIGIGWFRKEKNDRKVFQYMEEQQED